MKDEHGDETSINQRQGRASGEGNGGQRDECDGDRSLKAPVVAAVGRVRRGSRRSVVHAALDDLRKRRENVSGSAGLEGRSRDRLEDGLAPLDAEGRHDGGSEGALRGRGQSVAHEGGAERGSHGDYGVVRAESGECCGGATSDHFLFLHSSGVCFCLTTHAPYCYLIDG